MRMLLTGGIVVDPRNGIHGQADLLIEGGQVAAVGPALPTAGVQRVIDVRDRLVVPGIIDSHTHLSGSYGGPNGRNGHLMVTRVGVVTAIDMAADVDDLHAGIAAAGAGLNVGFLVPVVPGDTVAGDDPSAAEVRALVRRALGVGALGVKVLGGHYPLTPEATARTIRVAAEEHAYVAVHAGTTRCGSDIDGLEELVQLADGSPLHVAHVNAYCRGQKTGDAFDEARRALRALSAAPNVVSEAYLSAYNGTGARCQDGAPRSNVVKTCLRMGGFEPTEDGLQAAILAGWALVHRTAGGETVLESGEPAVRYWREQATDVGVSFPVNPPPTSILMALARNASGAFVVDAISTDGGCIPRNTIVAQGLPLVQFGALSLDDFVRKTSLNPARMLGFERKGHLGPGADADVTVLDLDRRRATLGLARGRLIMVDGVVVGEGATLLGRDAPVAAPTAAGDARQVAPAGA